MAKGVERSDHFKKHGDNCMSENIEISESLDTEVLLQDFPFLCCIKCISLLLILPVMTLPLVHDTFTSIFSRSPPPTSQNQPLIQSFSTVCPPLDFSSPVISMNIASVVPRPVHETANYQ